MEKDIKKRIDVEIELIAGCGGIFKVSIDNSEIFSKNKVGRFPEAEDILAKLE